MVSNSSVAIHAAKVRAEQENERIVIFKNSILESERINSANAVRALDIERQKDSELTEIASKSTLDILEKSISISGGPSRFKNPAPSR